MASLTYRSSRPDGWTMPRPHRDPSLRRHIHGPIQPMEEPGFFARLFGQTDSGGRGIADCSARCTASTCRCCSSTAGCATS